MRSKGNLTKKDIIKFTSAVRHIGEFNAYDTGLSQSIAVVMRNSVLLNESQLLKIEWGRYKDWDWDDTRFDLPFDFDEVEGDNLPKWFYPLLLS